MKNCFKKVFLLLMIVFSTVVIAGCTKDGDDTIYYEVKYIVENNEIAKYFVKEGQTAAVVTPKEIEGKIFQYWTLNGKEYKFDTPVISDLTFIASYIDDVNPDKPNTNVSDEVKAELEKVVAGANYSVVSTTETGSIKAEYKAEKDDLTTSIYYLEKGNKFTTVKMYVGINSGKIININVVQSDTLGKGENFNGTTLGVIGSTSNTLDDNFTSVSGATISSATVNELLVEALEMYATQNGGNENKMLSVTFDTDGGTKINTITVEKGQTFVRPNDPTRSFYHFIGWFLDGKAYDFSAPVTKDITLVAQWITVFQFDSKTQTIVDAVDLAGDVEIPTMINGIEVKNLGENLFKGNETITSVTIPASIENIEFSAFEGCTALKKVTFLGNENSNPIKFGINVFKGCTSLVDITIPVNASTISTGMFEECVSLVKLPIAGSITTISSDAFNGCVLLNEVILPEGLKEISKNAFEGCVALDRISFPESLTTIGAEAFKNCISIVMIYVTSKVTQINLNAFEGCTKLGTINVSIDNTKYSSINGALYDKKATTLMMVPNRTLKTFELPASVTSINTNAFANLVNLETITVEEGSTKFVAEEGVLYSKTTNYNGETTKIELIPAKFHGTVKILADTNNVASNLFANCPNVTEIVIDAENQYFVEIDHIIYRRASATSTYYTLVVANRNFDGVATILKDTEGTLSTVSPDAFINTTLSGVRLTWDKAKVSINTNIFASVPEGFKLYVPNGAANNFTGMTNTRWNAEFKEVVANIIVEDSAEN